MWKTLAGAGAVDPAAAGAGMEAAGILSGVVRDTAILLFCQATYSFSSNAIIFSSLLS